MEPAASTTAASFRIGAAPSTPGGLLECYEDFVSSLPFGSLLDLLLVAEPVLARFLSSGSSSSDDGDTSLGRNQQTTIVVLREKKNRNLAFRLPGESEKGEDTTTQNRAHDEEDETSCGVPSQLSVELTASSLLPILLASAPVVGVQALVSSSASGSVGMAGAPDPFSTLLTFGSLLPASPFHPLSISEPLVSTAGLGISWGNPAAQSKLYLTLGADVVVFTFAVSLGIATWTAFYFLQQRNPGLHLISLLPGVIGGPGDARAAPLGFDPPFPDVGGTEVREEELEEEEGEGEEEEEEEKEEEEEPEAEKEARPGHGDARRG